MHSIEIFLCLIAIARIPHSESSDVMPHYVKSVDVTFPLLHEYKITVSGKWAFHHYFDYAHTYTIEKKERSYSVKEESSYTYNRQGNSIDFEAQDVSVKVDKINEPLFKLKI
ncbi:hypothetical protein RF11_09971 [Thelohanellus kitauei]|uniref:Vitellogenin domain-containing protein n=1 Tax=Thelohanellus kitauei TaxID=669202 RepID=A0A0C2JN12_THEKT|nr:hypothetical protein RF11_09971 [Thelohanellus kitauei]